MLFAVVKKMPEYSVFMWDLCTHPSRLLFREQELSSEWRFQQGDPLEPFAFCLIIAPLVESLSSRLGLWYLDDATLGDPADKAFQDLQAIADSAKICGLKLSLESAKLSSWVELKTSETRRNTN